MSAHPRHIRETSRSCCNKSGTPEKNRSKSERLEKTDQKPDIRKNQIQSRASEKTRYKAGHPKKPDAKPDIKKTRYKAGHPKKPPHQKRYGGLSNQDFSYKYQEIFQMAGGWEGAFCAKAAAIRLFQPTAFWTMLQSACLPVGSLISPGKLCGGSCRRPGFFFKRAARRFTLL